MESTAEDDETDVAITMVAILGTMMAILFGLVLIQQPMKSDNFGSSRFFPHPQGEPSKYAYERFVMWYTPFWIGCFAIIVVGQLYESFDATTYNVVCGGLALPILLQPLFLVPATSPDYHRPLWKRYCTKANVWIFTYGFIGNYWYTHYFYSVLQARYTMPATRLNNVPLAMYFATHFYFTTYHLFSNCLLRKVVTTFSPTIQRHILFVAVVIVFSYFTAFMETLTISSFPYYTFQDRNMAYKVGSAFYGIYFLVSFPAFYYFDSSIDVVDGAGDKAKHQPSSGKKATQISSSTLTVWDSFVQSCGYSMIILCLLDFVRLALDLPLLIETESSSASI